MRQLADNWQNNWQTTSGTRKDENKVFFTKELLGRTYGTYPRWTSTRKDGFEDSGFVTGGGAHPSETAGQWRKCAPGDSYTL